MTPWCGEHFTFVQGESAMNQNLSLFGRLKRQAPRLVPALMVSLPLAACAQLPTGPTIAALPGKDMSAQDFQSADLACRNEAQFSFRLQAAPGVSATNYAAGGGSALVAAGYTPQQQYNVVYAQCMNARGAKINTAVVARYPNFPYYPYYPYSYEIYPWTTRVVCY
jgi:hypothetical protein